MTTEAIKQAVDEIHLNFEAFKKAQKEVIQQECKGYVDPLVSSQADRINEAITKAEDAKDVAEKAQSLVKAQRQVEEVIQHGLCKVRLSKEDEDYRVAFRKFLKSGIERLHHADQEILEIHTKKMSSGTDPAGGYFVLPYLDSEITRIVTETSEMRQVASIKTITTDQYEKMQSTDLAGAFWADRDEAPVETDTPTYKKLSIKVNKLYAEPQISQDLIDDAYIDIEAELAQNVAESFMVLENRAFIIGDGVAQPKGILDYAAGTTWGTIEQIPSGEASTLTYNGLIDLVYSLKDAYATRATFLMRRTTVAEVRKLTDLNEQPLWMPGFGSEPATLLGFPVRRAADMPAVAPNALAIAFGDFSRGYIIVDRMGTRILRDPYTSKPFVKFYTTKRVGGAVDNYEAIKLQKIST